MSIVVNCGRCGDELNEPGGLLFGTPSHEDGRPRKVHLCVRCTNAVGRFISLGLADPLDADQRIAALRVLLADQLAEFAKYSEMERSGEVDGSYVYDCAGDWFDVGTRAVYGNLLDIIAAP